MLQKTCTRCGLSKSLKEFSKNSRNKTTGKCAKCKACNALYESENKDRIAKRAKLYRYRIKAERSQKQKAYRDKRRAEMGDKIREYHQQYYSDNKAILNAKQRLRYEKNKENLKDYYREYAKNNRPAIRAQAKKRKAKLKMAIPSWADFNAIRAFYEKADALTKATGVEHEVDHIVPIRSNHVCGLHCQQNLQVLTALENNKKNNNWWPDMPDGLFVRRKSL